jgi:hypothetical protein
LNDGDLAQHAHHLLHVALAGIGDQNVAKHLSGSFRR